MAAKHRWPGLPAAVILLALLIAGGWGSAAGCLPCRVIKLTNFAVHRSPQDALRAAQQRRSGLQTAPARAQAESCCRVSGVGPTAGRGGGAWTRGAGPAPRPAQSTRFHLRTHPAVNSVSQTPDGGVTVEVGATLYGMLRPSQPELPGYQPGQVGLALTQSNPDALLKMFNINTAYGDDQISSAVTGAVCTYPADGQFLETGLSKDTLVTNPPVGTYVITCFLQTADNVDIDVGSFAVNGEVEPRVAAAVPGWNSHLKTTWPWTHPAHPCPQSLPASLAKSCWLVAPAARTARPEPSTPRLAAHAPNAPAPKTPTQSAPVVVGAGHARLACVAPVLHAVRQQGRLWNASGSNGGNASSVRTLPPPSPTCATFMPGVLAPALQCALLELRAPWKLAHLARSSLATCGAKPARLAPSNPSFAARAPPAPSPATNPTKHAPSVVGAGRGCLHCSLRGCRSARVPVTQQAAAAASLAPPSAYGG